MLNFSVQLFAQVERQALQHIEKGNWSKARSHLAKATRKDTLTIASSFAWATYFSTRANPDFLLDSANYHAQRALLYYQRATFKQRERLKRIPIDSILLTTLTLQIDSMAFHHALGSKKTTDYQHFLDSYPEAKQRSVAFALRNESAFREAVAEDSQQSFRLFIKSYPGALQMPEAIRRYDKLLFDSLTGDKRMISYQNYLQQYPNTPFTSEAARNIFEIQTASGTVESYLEFIAHGNKYFAARAKNILFYLLPPDQLAQQVPEIFQEDSIKIAIGLLGSYVAPVLHNGRFGFIDPGGSEVIAAESENIHEEYLCGNIADEVILLADKAVARSGAAIVNHPVNAIEEIGHGFLLVSTDTCTRLIHKTGFQVGPPCIDRARILHGKFLALQVSGKWGVFTITGRMLLSFQWDDISTIESVVVLKDKQKLRLLTETKLVSFAENNDGISMLIEVDALTKWSGNRLMVRQGLVRSVLTLTLDTLLNAGERNVYPAATGIILATPSGMQLINQRGEESPVFIDIKSDRFWTSVESAEGWSLLDTLTNAGSSNTYDTITFLGPLAIGLLNDSIHIHFSPTAVVKMKQPNRTVGVGMDSAFYLMVESENKKNVYDHHGARLFTVPYDRIQYIGEGYFTVYRRDKIGLVNREGKLVVPVDMDAIGSVRNGLVSVLKNAKFGSFNCRKVKFIAPQYANNLVPYNDTMVVVLLDGLYRLVSWENTFMLNAGFDEIQHWNDTAAFVRKELQWMICEIKSGKILMDGIRNFKLIRDDNADKLAIINADHNFGVLHNQKGIVIPFSFTDIINVGSPTQPLYFAEKRVEEAELFVVLYYNAAGKFVRREVYDHNDYERIYCPNN